jgi:hypothetical protein
VLYALGTPSRSGFLISAALFLAVSATSLSVTQERPGEQFIRGRRPVHELIFHPLKVTSIPLNMEHKANSKRG